jgi:hypothetical protein
MEKRERREIIRGTTPTIFFNFEGTGVNVTDVENAELYLEYGTEKKVVPMSGMEVDTENNVLMYHFTQADTLSLPRGTILCVTLVLMAGEDRMQSQEIAFVVTSTPRNKEM